MSLDATEARARRGLAGSEGPRGVARTRLEFFALGAVHRRTACLACWRSPSRSTGNAVVGGSTWKHGRGLSPTRVRRILAGC